MKKSNVDRQSILMAVFTVPFRLIKGIIFVKQFLHLCVQIIFQASYPSCLYTQTLFQTIPLVMQTMLAYL